MSDDQLANGAIVTQAAPVDPFFDDDDLAEDLLDQHDDSAPELFINDLPVTDEPEEPFEDVDDDDFDDDVLEGGVAIAPTPIVMGDPAADERIAKLEAAARELAAAEVKRENGRVKRKVTAATTGAGAVGFVPILLQLVGAVNLDPEIAMTVATLASLFGAFAAGWVTPERTPPLAQDAAHSLLKLGED